MLLSQALEEYIEVISGTRAPSTVYTYTDLLRRFIAWVGDQEVLNIKMVHISQYITHLKKKNYSGKSVSIMVISVRSLFKHLFENGYVKWQYSQIKPPRHSTNHFPTVTRDEALSMLGKIHITDFQSLRDLALSRFLFATGVRSSELCRITVDQLDMTEGDAQIVGSKNFKDRIVTWDPETHQVLEQYLLQREDWATDEHLFISVSASSLGKGLTTRSVQRIVTKHRQGSRVVPHSFRSCLITDMLEHGSDLETTRKILGHSSIMSLEPYARLTKKHLKSEYKRVRG